MERDRRARSMPLGDRHPPCWAVRSCMRFLASSQSENCDWFSFTCSSRALRMSRCSSSAAGVVMPKFVPNRGGKGKCSKLWKNSFQSLENVDAMSSSRFFTLPISLVVLRVLRAWRGGLERSLGITVSEKLVSARRCQTGLPRRMLRWVPGLRTPYCATSRSEQ